MRPPILHNRHHGTATRDAIYIGRGTRWGNPFIVGKDGNRREVVQKFECQILPELDLSPLIGKDLVCSCVARPWCVGDSEPRECHGMPILRALAVNHPEFFG